MREGGWRGKGSLLFCYLIFCGNPSWLFRSEEGLKSRRRLAKQPILRQTRLKGGEGVISRCRMIRQAQHQGSSSDSRKNYIMMTDIRRSVRLQSEQITYAPLSSLSLNFFVSSLFSTFNLFHSLTPPLLFHSFPSLLLAPSFHVSTLLAILASSISLRSFKCISLKKCLGPF